MSASSRIINFLPPYLEDKKVPSCLKVSFVAPTVAIFFIFNAFLASEVFNSIYDHLYSFANAIAELVFPIPGLPIRIIALFFGIPLFQDSAHDLSSNIAFLFPTISFNFLGLYFSVQLNIYYFVY